MVLRTKVQVKFWVEPQQAAAIRDAAKGKALGEYILNCVLREAARDRGETLAVGEGDK